MHGAAHASLRNSRKASADFVSGAFPKKWRFTATLGYMTARFAWPWSTRTSGCPVTRPDACLYLFKRGRTQSCVVRHSCPCLGGFGVALGPKFRFDPRIGSLIWNVAPIYRRPPGGQSVSHFCPPQETRPPGASQPIGESW